MLKMAVSVYSNLAAEEAEGEKSAYSNLAAEEAEADSALLVEGEKSAYSNLAAEEAEQKTLAALLKIVHLERKKKD